MMLRDQSRENERETIVNDFVVIELLLYLFCINCPSADMGGAPKPHGEDTFYMPGAAFLSLFSFAGGFPWF